jgi:MFS family permease
MSLSPSNSNQDSVWSPLKFPVYRAFWICAFISNTGTWIQDVASSWVMTHLSTSPLVISLLSFTSSLPVVLLSLPAGYIADLGYRRQVLLVAQSLMCLCVALIAWNVYQGQITEFSLLGLSLLIGVGFALTNPAFQSVLTDLVPPEKQAQAVLVYYIGINITRVAGPSIGGGLLGAFGPAVAFFVNTFSFLGLILFFYRWPIQEKNSKFVRPVIQESDWQPLLSLSNMRLWAEIFLVTYFASALWALYPTRGRVELHLSSYQYGSLMAFLGLGACLSAFMSEKIMHPARTRRSLAGAYAVYAAGLLVLGIGTEFWHLCVAMFLAGTGWLVLATLMNMSSRQITGVSQLKATMLGVFLAVFYAGMALGAISWGTMAGMSSTTTALVTAAIGLSVIGFLKLRALFLF